MRIVFDKKIIDTDKVYKVNDYLILYDMEDLTENQVSVFGFFSIDKSVIETIYNTLAEYGTIDVRHVYEEWDMDSDIVIFDGIYDLYSSTGIPIYKQLWKLNGEKSNNFPEEFNKYCKCFISKL